MDEKGWAGHASRLRFLFRRKLKVDCTLGPAALYDIVGCHTRKNQFDPFIVGTLSLLPLRVNYSYLLPTLLFVSCIVPTLDATLRARLSRYYDGPRFIMNNMRLHLFASDILCMYTGTIESTASL